MAVSTWKEYILRCPTMHLEPISGSRIRLPEKVQVNVGFEDEIMSFCQDWKSRSLGEIITDRIRAWWQFPEHPLPWSTEIETAVRAPDAIPVCHRCITPCDLPAWFCPSCGAAFGPYNNILPFVRIYSIGEALRSGVGTEAHFTPFRMLAYISIGLVEYQIFAPLYYFRLYRNYRRTKKEPNKASHPIAASRGEG